jgi:hypothetical protein
MLNVIVLSVVMLSGVAPRKMFSFSLFFLIKFQTQVMLYYKLQVYQVVGMSYFPELAFFHLQPDKQYA